MTEFSGSLEGIGLQPIVRFLHGMRKSGRLRISHEGWTGELSLEGGEVVGASFGAERGLAALDAMALTLAQGQFTFTDGGAVEQRNLSLDYEALQAHLDRLSGRQADPKAASPSAQPSTGAPVWRRAALEAVPPADEAQPASGRQPVLRGDQALSGGSDGAPHTLPPAAEGTSTASAAAYPCPKLGISQDPSSIFSFPTPLHRCFAFSASEPIALEYQQEFCLTNRFPDCARYIAATYPSVRPEVAPSLTVTSTEEGPAHAQTPRSSRAPARSPSEPAEEASAGETLSDDLRPAAHSPPAVPADGFDSHGASDELTQVIQLTEPAPAEQTAVPAAQHEQQGQQRKGGGLPSGGRLPALPRRPMQVVLVAVVTALALLTLMIALALLSMVLIRTPEQPAALVLWLTS